MKSKPTKVTKLDKKDSFGNTTYVVEFENLDKGFYTSKSDNQSKFVVGQEVEYLIEEKQGKTGNTYFKVTLPQSDKQFTGSGRPQVDPKVQMISFAMAYTKDLIVGGKLDIKDLEIGFTRMYNIMTSKL
jgi:hypothetical protein